MRSFAFGLLVSLFSVSASALTLSQVITEVRTLILDGSSASRQRFSDSTITDLANQAQREALTQTRCLRQSQSFQLVAGTTYYALPSNYLSMERLTIGAKYIQEMSPGALDGRSRGWESSSGYPTYYFINWSSPSVVGFAPWPGSFTDTDTIKMEYDVQANDMSAGTDIPFNGVIQMYDYHHMLSYFAASVLSAVDGQPARQQAYQSVYSGMVTAMMKRCLDRPGFNPSATGSQ